MVHSITELLNKTIMFRNGFFCKCNKGEMTEGGKTLL